MMAADTKTLFDKNLSDDITPDKTVSVSTAEEIFNFFRSSKLFRWQDANNDCEDRANAICILLDKWNIPNYKGWVMSGYFLKRENSSLINNWNYHVAALLPVIESGSLTFYIIDPATSSQLIKLQDWATAVTATPVSYHFIKTGDTYIFPSGKIERNNWYKRNKRNLRWTMQGLSGINGVSSTGKAQLCFRKEKVKLAQRLFNEMKNRAAMFAHHSP